MKRIVWIFVLLCYLTITACSAPDAENDGGTAKSEESVVEPTETEKPTPVFTPTATSIPGLEVIPISEMGDTVPWQPLGDDVPYVLFYGFNVTKPPFNDVRVRKAFAAAVDREALVELAINNGWKNVSPSTTFLPPSMLGRDLYNAVGIPFDPEYARDLLVEAGYSDPSQFPPVTLSSNTMSNNTPEFASLAVGMINMWVENLGIQVEFRKFGGVESYYSFIFDEPGNVYIYKGMYSPGEEEGLDPQLINIF